MNLFFTFHFSYFETFFRVNDLFVRSNRSLVWVSPIVLDFSYLFNVRILSILDQTGAIVRP